jgi:hypothetical protein
MRGHALLIKAADLRARFFDRAFSDVSTVPITYLQSREWGQVLKCLFSTAKSDTWNAVRALRRRVIVTT